MTKEEIIDVIHKTMYQFFDVCGDNEEVPMSDKDELLLSVNKAICNNIKALEREQCADVVEREKIDKAIKEMERYSTSFEYANRHDLASAVDCCIGMIQKNIGEKANESND